MAQGSGSASLSVLQLFNRRELWQTCRWRCHWQCFDSSHNDSSNEAFGYVLAEAVSRRALLRGAVGSAAMLVVGRLGLAGRAEAQVMPRVGPSVGFTPISANTDDRLTIAPGYAHAVVIRWGDPLFSDSPAFDVRRQSAAAQARQFGYNCDYVSFMPLPRGSAVSDRGLLVINHEYTNPELMFAGYREASPTREEVDVELAAHGVSVVEVRRRGDGTWQYLRSARNFRITATTPLSLSGPAVGHPLLRTGEDATGTRVLGVLNNCGGGATPWGTVLTAEENFNQYFANAGQLDRQDRRTRWHTRYGLTAEASERRWEHYYGRFDLAREPNEPFRFGWVVEVDPYDPGFVPRKRTALGRMKHEAATTVVSPGGRVVVYMGDDERFEYVYKFVSARSIRRDNRAHNLTLLDDGILYVARFNADGTGVWLPLVFGQGPLTPSNGFENQGDVLINVRGAADLLGGTKMDRPEDIEANPMTGAVYCVMTNNNRRTPQLVDAANPRPNNRFGHILEVFEEGRDHVAPRFSWQVFMLCGDASDSEHAAYFAGFSPDRVSAISAPDNIVFDRQGNLWIATDGQPGTLRRNDGIFMTPVSGPLRGYLRQFLSAPFAAEVCGPEFTPDNRTLFCAIQHPGEGGTFDKPTSKWPDGDGIPRPAVAAIWHARGGVIGD